MNDSLNKYCNTFTQDSFCLCANPFLGKHWLRILKLQEKDCKTFLFKWIFLLITHEVQPDLHQ